MIRWIQFIVAVIYIHWIQFIVAIYNLLDVIFVVVICHLMNVIFAAVFDRLIKFQPTNWNQNILQLIQMQLHINLRRFCCGT